ncbi:MAG: 2-C-methyl-D-erythritol 4-phosphate cytidylyltransferase [Spirochaetaceae bacterium]|jgi:2-C-methyl-D-erythritol 4-phosphate cytidylyltransferase|nr:2-C-methyl-D-erythritol 4-phosphate cytidylyltransferase [Spirochaetaceae bacterium]
MDAPAAAVIVAAGSSDRMGGRKKEYLPLGKDAVDGEGKPLSVLGAAVLAFASVPRIDPIIIVVPANGEQGEYAARLSLPSRLFYPGARPRILFVPGGPSRRLSVHHGLSLLEGYRPALVLIHDGARPWVEGELIERTIDGALKYRAVVPVMPLTETPKEVGPEGIIRRHLRRSQTVTAQTPQGFIFPEILRAHEKAAERELGEGVEYTDDAEIWGEFCGPVASIPGSAVNRKITFPGDLEGP